MANNTHGRAPITTVSDQQDHQWLFQGDRLFQPRINDNKNVRVPTDITDITDITEIWPCLPNPRAPSEIKNLSLNARRINSGYRQSLIANFSMEHPLVAHESPEYSSTGRGN